MIKRLRKRISDFFSDIVERPILVTTMVFFFMFLLVVSVSYKQFIYNSEAFIPNLMAEGFGTVFDLLIIGIFLLWINKLGEKKMLIRGYKEEIDDFRNWDNDEAMFKIVGSIKRLNQHKVFELDLYECHMRNARLEYINMSGSNLNFTTLENANLTGANLNGVRANQLNLKGAKLNDTLFQKSLLTGAIFKDAVAIRADFRGCMLIKADFSGTFLMEADLSNAQLIEADFTEANLYKADLRGAIGLNWEQLGKARTIHMAQFDEALLKELKLHLPHFFSENGASDHLPSSNPTVSIASQNFG